MSGHLSSSGNWACRANEPDKPRCPRTLNVSLFLGPNSCTIDTQYGKVQCYTDSAVHCIH